MSKLSAFGKWSITTEGDVEGRTIRDLGVYEGFIDEIALRLGDEAYYSLRFSPFKEKPQPPLSEKCTSVSVTLDIDTGTWDMKGPQRVAYFRDLLAGRPVIVKEGAYYASVVLSVPSEEAVKIRRERALAKLTAEEKELLGVDENA